MSYQYNTSAAVALAKAAAGATNDVGGVKYIPPTGTSDYAEVIVGLTSAAAASAYVRCNADTASATVFDVILAAGQVVVLPLVAPHLTRVASVAIYSTAALTEGTDYWVVGK